MRLHPLALSGASLAALVAASAQAQDARDEPIVVTAQLREQDPIDVPITLSVLRSEELERLGVRQFDELSRYIPGFTVQNQAPNDPGFAIRGITSDDGSATDEPRVSVFQDGVSISKSRGSYVELFDVSRVEVAKGPQSTLYGRGALIGAVNIIQNKAELGRLALSGGFSYGNYNAWTADAMVNAPIGDHVAVRVAGRIRKRDGYVENLLGGRDYNSANTRAIRGSLHAETGMLGVDVIGNYQQDTPIGISYQSIAYSPTDPVTGAVLGDRGRDSGAALVSASGFAVDRPLGLDRKVWGVTGIARLTLDARFSLISITAYRRFDALEVFDADGISLPILTAAEDARGNQASQEFRLNYKGGAITAFVGASYFHEDGFQRVPIQFDEGATLAQLTGALNGGGTLPGRPASDSAPAALFADPAFTGLLLQGLAGAYGVPLPAAQARAIAANLRSGHLESYTNGSRTNSLDVFGDLTVNLSDRFELGAGLRYSHDDKRSTYASEALSGRSILGGVLAALNQPAPARDALLLALAAPGAGTIPPSAAYPVPLFGLAVQPTANNGDNDGAALRSGGFSWRFTARYMPADDTSVYATYARGRRPEVLSASSPVAPFAATGFSRLPSERVDSYELGAKTALMNRTLQLDGAVFYYAYDNFQTIVQQGTQFVVTNAGKAESYGFEGQANWAPNRFVSLFATYAYNHGRFSTGALSGNHFRLSPDHEASLGIIATVPLGAGRISLTPSVTWQSKIFFDDNNDRPDLQRPPATLVADAIQDERQGSYALVNARLGYQAPDGGWRIEGYVKNLLDRQYIIDAGNTGDTLGLPTFIAGAPRFYGISAIFRFGASS